MKRILAASLVAATVAAPVTVVGTASAAKYLPGKNDAARIRTVDAVAPVASLRIRRIR